MSRFRNAFQEIFAMGFRWAMAVVRVVAAMDASAATFSTDASERWYASPADSEAGWGVNVAQQGSVLFLTMFVYGPNSQPTWLVGSNIAYSGSSGAAMTFTGPLYATVGSSYAAPWNPAAMSYRQVGSVSFTLNSPTTATLTYTADGTQVRKNLVRQTWKFSDLSGQYIGGVAGTFSQCANPATNGFTLEYASAAITHSGSNFSMDLENFDKAGSCSYDGTYVQSGRLGSVTGHYSCTGGNTGTFTASEVEATTSGFVMKVQESSSSCNWAGRIGGVRATP